MKRLLRSLATIGVIASAWAGPRGTPAVTPAAPAGQDARAAARKAQELAQQGQLDQAATAIDEAFAASSATGDTQAAALLLFTQGWLDEQRALRSPDAARQALESAERNYRLALGKQPDYAPAVENLALVLTRLDRPDEGVSLLRSISDRGTLAHQGKRWITIGELEQRRGQLALAIEAYRRAFDLEPVRAAAAEGLIRLSSRAPGKEWPDLLSTAGRCSSAGLLEPASRWYAALSRSAETSDQRIVALVKFVRTEAVRGALTPASLELLGEARDGIGPFVDEVLALLAAPAPSILQAPSWLARPDARDVPAWVCSCLAERALAEERVEDAADLLERTLAELPNPAETDTGPDETTVALGIAARLARLLHVLPKLDPEKNRFAALEKRLLDAKSIAYEQQNLPVIQQFHITLGLIYVELDRWHGDIRSAPWHLERAVGVAQRIAKREPSEYKPLPHLDELLATGLQNNDQPAKARRVWLDATMGYLDLDEVAEAANALRAAARLRTVEEVADASLRARETALGQILALRSPAHSFTKEQVVLAAKVDSPFAKKLQYFDRELPGLDPVFAHRQKLRVLDEARSRAVEFDLELESRAWRERWLKELSARQGGTQRDLGTFFGNPPAFGLQFQVGIEDVDAKLIDLKSLEGLELLEAIPPPKRITPGRDRNE